MARDGRSAYVMFPELKILPSFDKLWNGYPNTPPVETVAAIGGKIEDLFGPTLRGEANTLFTNTCVVRTSAAFNVVARDHIPYVGQHDLESGQGNDGRGHGVPRGNIGVPLKLYKGGSTWADGREKAYAIKVSEFAPFMHHYYPDAPTIEGTTNPRSFVGARGVLQFKVGDGVWDDATGHFDIWDGFQSTVRAAIRYSAYFDQASKTVLWQHVIIRLDKVETANGVCTAIYRYYAR